MFRSRFLSRPDAATDTAPEAIEEGGGKDAEEAKDVVEETKEWSAPQWVDEDSSDDDDEEEEKNKEVSEEKQASQSSHVVLLYKCININKVGYM